MLKDRGFGATLAGLLWRLKRDEYVEYVDRSLVSRIRTLERKTDQVSSHVSKGRINWN